MGQKRHKNQPSCFTEEQELLCTDCFTFLHCKGNRQLHLFTDATNLLLLLERMDPAIQEHLRGETKRSTIRIKMGTK